MQRIKRVGATIGLVIASVVALPASSAFADDPGTAGGLMCNINVGRGDAGQFTGRFSCTWAQTGAITIKSLDFELPINVGSSYPSPYKDAKYQVVVDGSEPSGTYATSGTVLVQGAGYLAGFFGSTNEASNINTHLNPPGSLSAPHFVAGQASVVNNVLTMTSGTMGGCRLADPGGWCMWGNVTVDNGEYPDYPSTPEGSPGPTGTNPTDGGPCEINTATGPTPGASHTAGDGGTVTFAWTGDAETLRVLPDVNVSNPMSYAVTVAADTSPQDVDFEYPTAGKTAVAVHVTCGDGSVSTLSIAADGDINTGYKPPVRPTIGSCFSNTGIDINPVTWVPAIARGTSCILQALFVPDVTSTTQAVRDAVDGSAVGSAGDMFAMLQGSWEAMADGAASTESGCEGPAVDLPIPALDNPRIALLSACAAPASTFAPTVRTAVLFGLVIMVGLAVIRGIGRLVGYTGGVA